MYGITVNTSAEVSTEHPNRDGRYGLVYPMPGKMYPTLTEAEAAFASVVAEQRATGEDFLALLNSFSGRAERTLRRETK